MQKVRWNIFTCIFWSNWICESKSIYSLWNFRCQSVSFIFLTRKKGQVVLYPKRTRFHKYQKSNCPIATYTQYNFSLSGVPCALICFWFNMVSIAIVVFPVCLSPIISFHWPRPIRTRLSTAFNLVCMGSCTNLRAIL
jgi:hypothetical protein